MEKKRPLPFMLVKKYLEESGLKDKENFTNKFLIKKVVEEAMKASENINSNGDRKALQEKLTNVVFLMTSIVCLMDIDVVDALNKRIEEFKKGNHPILDEFVKSR